MRVECYGENGGPSGGPVSQGGAPAEGTQGQGHGGATKSVSGLGWPPLPEHHLPLSPALSWPWLLTCAPFAFLALIRFIVMCPSSSSTNITFFR